MKAFSSIIVMGALLITPPACVAHSGGLDANGCHAGSPSLSLPPRTTGPAAPATHSPNGVSSQRHVSHAATDEALQDDMARRMHEIPAMEALNQTY